MTMSTYTKFSPNRAQSIFSLLADALAVVPEFVSAIGRARETAHAYERLSHLSDVELSRRGLSREVLPQYVYQRYMNG